MKVDSSFHTHHLEGVFDCSAKERRAEATSERAWHYQLLPDAGPDLAIGIILLPTNYCFFQTVTLHFNTYSIAIAHGECTVLP